jgi:hypothetical protein
MDRIDISVEPAKMIKESVPFPYNNGLCEYLTVANCSPLIQSVWEVVKYPTTSSSSIQKRGRLALVVLYIYKI